MNSKPPPNPQDCKPTFRDTTVGRMTYAFKATLEAMHEDAYKTCLTCINFKEHGDQTRYPPTAPETCTRFGGRPPARIIAYGCPEYYHDDEIPF